jgi:glycerophosphoryl diester phosphodiesterase
MVLEIKPSINHPQRGIQVAKKVYELIQSLNALAWTIYISFDLEILKTLIELDKNAHTQYLRGELSPAQLKSLHIAGIAYQHSVYKKAP